MAGVDQPLQALRPAVAVLRRVGKHPVVAPVPRARELGDRHDLDGRDAQIAEVAQPGDDAVERALGREGADVQLVEDQVLAADALPAAVGPGEPIRPDDRRRPMDPLGLPERAGIGPLGPAVEPERIATALGDVRLLVAVVAAFLRLHRDLAAPRRRSGPGPPCCAAGAQTRKPTDPSGDPTAPHRRAGPPCLISFIRIAYFASSDPGASGPTNSPARFRLADDPMDGRLRPSRPTVPLSGRTPARPPGPASRRDGCPPDRTRVARAAPHAATGAASGRPTSRRNGRTSSRRRHSAGGLRTSRTGSSRSSVGSSWQVRPCHAAGEARAVEESIAPIRGRGPTCRRCDSRPPIPFAQPSPLVSIRGGLIAIRRDASRTPGTTQKSSSPMAPATRGRRPSGRWFHRGTQVACHVGAARAADLEPVRPPGGRARSGAATPPAALAGLGIANGQEPTLGVDRWFSGARSAPNDALPPTRPGTSLRFPWPSALHRPD